jgi:integrase
MPKKLKRLLMDHLATRDSDNPYIFTAEKGTPLNPGMFYKTLQQELKGSQFEKIHPHTLRHSCVAFLIAQNVHPLMISKILGHSNIGTTMGLYGHLFPTHMAEAVGNLDTYIGDLDEDSDKKSEEKKS